MWNKILDYFGLRERKPRHFVAWFLVLAFGLFTYLYFEAMDYKVETGTLLPFFPYDIWFVIFTVVLSLFDGFLMFFAIKYFGAKQKLPFLIVGAVGLLFACITLFAFPGVSVEGNLVYTLETGKLFEYLMATIMVFVSIYIFIVIVPQIIKDRNYYNLFFVIAICTALFGTIFSYITEVDLYAELFTAPHPYHSSPQSFTGDRNTYAFILVIAMVSEAYLIIKNNWVLHWILFYYFFINTMFTLSKTSIIMAFAFFSIFVIWRTVVSIKDHPIRALIFSAAMIVLAGACLIVALTPFEKDSFMDKPHTFLEFLMVDLPNLNGRSFDTRINCYNQAVESLSTNGVTKFFGFGYMNWQHGLYSYFKGYVPMDVAFAVNLLQFGVPGFAFSASLWLFTLFMNGRLFKHKSAYAGVTAITLLILLARTFTEAGDLTFPNLTGTIYYLMVLCPMLTEIKSIKASESVVAEA
ncbi:MAG: hypothetical protein IKQ34_00325 [Bacilli bacterium]|nr:hypothetical protein [Bacilli bacterium]